MTVVRGSRVAGAEGRVILRRSPEAVEARKQERIALLRPIFARLQWRGQRKWLAGLLGIHIQNLLDYENGRVTPDPKIIKRACAILAIDPGEIDMDRLAALRLARGRSRKTAA